MAHNFQLDQRMRPPPVSRYNHLPSSPIDSSYRPSSNDGHYGKDGAPPSRFMSPIPPAASGRQHYPQSRPPAVKLNIAKSQPRPTQDRFNHQHQTKPQDPFRDPDYHIHQQRSHQLNQPKPLRINKPRLSPPRAAFVDPQSPTRSIQSFDSGSDYDQRQQILTQQSSIPPSLSSSASSSSNKSFQKTRPSSVLPLRKLESNGFSSIHGASGDSDWLQKQRNSKRRFQLILGVAFIVLLLIIVGVVLSVVNKKSESPPPKALSWANGASADSIPSFARDSTNTPSTTRQPQGSH
ncbi:hypothetical protein BY996DRAFT_603811 [Phakopsora pachyrhizi]|uniref:Uncharacterized protein n=1 Tax=Phakopsora pachyrhizi TaxID=170000 RepID=A0AAV0BFS1_PHAPC|nr:hypothetical protein BY996DRAFT_603811 [Phakopsora pachyrhizi]CAH7685456.1 hypothetical protein PPACK8108_LOCUS19981 [Phakopsora pachyrhizi]